MRPIVEMAKNTALARRMADGLGKPLKTEGEIRPTDMVPVIAPDRSGVRSVFPMVWGYNIPGLGRPVVNVRVETAARKEIWRQGWESHRCIIPASWYFEWEHILTAGGKMKAGQKYMIKPTGSDMTWLAGIYRLEEFQGMKYPVFSVLTKPPAKELQRIHDRMPLILPASAIDDWIRPGSRAEDLVKAAVEDLFIKETKNNVLADVIKSSI